MLPAAGTRWSCCQMLCLPTLFMWLFLYDSSFCYFILVSDLMTSPHVCVHRFAWLALLKRLFRRIKSVIQPDETPASFILTAAAEIRAAAVGVLSRKEAERRRSSCFRVSKVGLLYFFPLKAKVAITIINVIVSSHISELICQLICKDKCHEY